MVILLDIHSGFDPSFSLHDAAGSLRHLILFA